MGRLGYIPQGGQYHTREYMRALGRAWARAGLAGPEPHDPPGRLRWYLARAGLERNYVRWRGSAYLVGLAWPLDSGAFPRLYWSEIIPYLSDCWPAHYDRWAQKLRALRTRVVFVNGSGSARALQERLPNANVHWIPEGITSSDWKPGLPLTERSSDVLELGRHYPRYHEAITGRLRPGVTHRFSEAGSRTLIFESDEALKHGLADTKIQICFPKSITHPETGPQGGPGAGDLEVLTQRYLEAMVAGSLIVGHAPRDLVELFGYDPVIEADLDDPVRQLHRLLDQIEDYQPLIERNRQRLAETCSWDVHVAKMLAILGERGYDVPEPVGVVCDTGTRSGSSRQTR